MLSRFFKRRPDYTGVNFRVVAPLDHGETIAVVGDSRALGSFNLQNAVHLVTTPGTYPVWETKTPVLLPNTTVKYKYVIFSGGRFKAWEPRGDRELAVKGRRMVVEDVFGEGGPVLESAHRHASSTSTLHPRRPVSERFGAGKPSVSAVAGGAGDGAASAATASAMHLVSGRPRHHSVATMSTRREEDAEDGGAAAAAPPSAAEAEAEAEMAGRRPGSADADGAEAPLVSVTTKLEPSESGAAAQPATTSTEPFGASDDAASGARDEADPRSAAVQPAAQPSRETAKVPAPGVPPVQVAAFSTPSLSPGISIEGAPAGDLAASLVTLQSLTDKRLAAAALLRPGIVEPAPTRQARGMSVSEPSSPISTLTGVHSHAHSHAHSHTAAHPGRISRGTGDDMDEDVDAAAEMEASSMADPTPRSAPAGTGAAAFSGRLFLLTYLLPVRIMKRLDGSWHVRWAQSELAARSQYGSVADVVPTMWVGTVPLIKEELAGPYEPPEDDPFASLQHENPYFRSCSAYEHILPEEKADGVEGMASLPARVGAAEGGSDGSDGSGDGGDGREATGTAAPASRTRHFRMRTLRQDEQAEITRLLHEMNCTPLFVPAELHEAHYNGFCRSILWPAFHNVLELGQTVDGVDRLTTREVEKLLAAFRQVNTMFADVVLRVHRPRDVVWVHDYHLMLVPRVLRDRLTKRRQEQIRTEHEARWKHLPPHLAPPPTLSELRAMPWNIVFFLHTPFPTSEIFRTLSMRKELLQGMLAADLVGVHVFNYARHFLNACKRFLGLTYQSRKGGNIGLDFRGRNVMVTVAHVSIEYELCTRQLEDPTVRHMAEALRSKYPGRTIVVGIDRCQRLQGVSHKLLAFEWLLTDYPGYASKVVLVQRCQYSRSRSHDTLKSSAEIRKLIRRIKAKVPAAMIDYQEREGEIPLLERLALYLAGDVMLQTPICEGLNRIAHEYTFVHSPPNPPGTLVLSEFSASNHALNGCLRVNPFHVSHVAQTLDEAMSMSPAERAGRVGRDLAYLKGLSSGAWTKQVIMDMLLTHRVDEQFTDVDAGEEEAVDAPKTHLLGPSSQFSFLHASEASAAFRTSRKRVIILNCGGTVVARENVGMYFKQDFRTSRGLHRDAAAALEQLGTHPATHVFLVSGAEHRVMQGRFGSISSATLVAESGARFSWGSKVAALTERSGVREPGVVQRYWQTVAREEPTEERDVWMETARRVIQPYVWRTNGSEMLVAPQSVSWDYRNADPQWGAEQAKSVIAELREELEDLPVMIVRKKGIVEVAPAISGKGAAVRRILEAVADADFVLCVGDDSSDESMFTAVYAHMAKREAARTRHAFPKPRPAPSASAAVAVVEAVEGAAAAAAAADAAAGAPGGPSADAEVPSGYEGEDDEVVPRRSGAGAGAGAGAGGDTADSDSDTGGEADMKVFTVTVGMKPSHARFFLNSTVEVWQVLNRLREVDTGLH